MGLIYLDTCLVIYLAEQRAPWSQQVERAMVKARGARLGIAPLVKMECLVGPIKRADVLMQRRFEDWFGMFAMLDMPEPVYLQAAQLRARFGLKTPDALHLACAQHHRCEALWTNDDRLAKASRGLARKLPI